MTSPEFFSVRLTHLLWQWSFIIAIWLLSVAAAPAHGAGQPAVPRTSGSGITQQLEQGSQQGGEDDDRYLIRRVDRLEDRVTVQQQAEARFGLLITISGIGFAAIIAIVVVVFALRTEKVAAAAARDEIRTSIGSIEESVADARRAASEAREIAKRLRAVLDSAEADAAQLAARAAPTSVDPENQATLTPEERGRLDRAAAITSGKPFRELSLPELRIRLADASERKAWQEVIEVATAMRVLYPSDRVIAEALNAEGTALSELGRTDEALVKFSEVIERYAG